MLRCLVLAHTFQQVWVDWLPLLLLQHAPPLPNCPVVFLLLLHLLPCLRPASGTDTCTAWVSSLAIVFILFNCRYWGCLNSSYSYLYSNSARANIFSICLLPADDFESKFQFHPVEDLPPPDDFKPFPRIYPSKENRGDTTGYILFPTWDFNII